MGLQFHAIRLVPTCLCASPACIPRVLDAPIVERVPVEDLIGVPYAYDLQLTQGFYVTVGSYLLLRSLLRAIVRAVKSQKVDHEGFNG